MYPSYFRRLYREAEAEGLGLPFPEFCAALEQIGRRQLPAAANPHEAAEFYQKLHLKDLALAMACSHGIPSGWERLAGRYREKLYIAALVIARNESTARELADSLCGELFISRESPSGKLASYTGRGSLEGWLKAILAQSYVDRYRSRRRDMSLDEQVTAIGEVCASEEVRVDPRLNAAIQDALLTLPPENRYLLASYFFDQRTLAEIALTLGVHESTVSRRMNRLVRRLRRSIARLMSEKGMTVRQVEETLQTDVRDMSLNLQSHLLRGAELAGK